MAVGYEFTKKDIRKEFKNSQLGKNINLFFYIFLSVLIVSLICTIIVIIIKQLSGQELYDTALKINALPGMLAVYFDGKRDGAIIQFESQKKAKK